MSLIIAIVIHTPAAWPELLIQSDAGIKTDTYSTDWQFAPHPTLLLFRKLKFQLCMARIRFASGLRNVS